MNPSSKILLVGGSGTLGKPTAQLLVNAGYPLRLMTRYPEKVGNFRSPEMEIVKGDLIDPDSLKIACEGMDLVIAMAHSLLGVGKYRSAKVDVKGHKSLIDIAKSAGVKSFVYISVVGADANQTIDFWRNKFEVEQYLQKSGLNFINIRSTAFMETHIHELMGKGILKNGKAMIMGKGNNPLNFVSVVDVAQIILKSLEQPEALNSIIEIGGPDNLSRNEIVSLYEKYSGKQVKCTYLSIGFLNIMSKLFKPFHQGISRVMALGEVLDQTDQTFDPTRTLQRFPIKLTTIDHFIQQQCK